VPKVLILTGDAAEDLEVFYPYQRLLEEGYLSAGYNPLMLTPGSIKKLLYNPAPLNKIIAKACLSAWHKKHGSRDPRSWSGSLSQRDKDTQAYADQNLIRGVEGNSGRDALLTLEEILRSRKGISHQGVR
jgi:hypothetical protein